MTTIRYVDYCTLGTPSSSCCTTNHRREQRHNSGHCVRRCPGRLLWTSCRCGNSGQTNRYHSSRLHTGASHRRLRCIQTLPVDIYHWAHHRSWMSSTRPSARVLLPASAPPPWVGKAANWLEGGVSQDRARSQHQWIQTQLCSQPKAAASRKCSQGVGERWSNQIMGRDCYVDGEVCCNETCETMHFIILNLLDAQTSIPAVKRYYIIQYNTIQTYLLYLTVPTGSHALLFK